MKLTIFILIFPIVIFVAGILLIHRPASDAMSETFLSVWAAASLLCLIRGFFIFRRHQRLAWCCFIISLMQIVFAILPLLASHKTMDL
jgi:hypothetical protein